MVAEAHPLDCGSNSGIPKSAKALLQPTHALLLWFPNAATAATRQPENCGGGIGTEAESIGIAKETRRGPVQFEARIVLPPLFLPSRKRQSIVYASGRCKGQYHLIRKRLICC